MEENLIATKNLFKEISGGNDNISILKDINIGIKEKEYVSIMGASGSGKSTLLGILAGIDKPSSGDVIVNGVNISELSENKLTAFRNDNIGIVFQSFNLIPTLSVSENIEIPLFFSKKRKDNKKVINDILELVGLQDKKDSMPKTLSGGEQQRVAIARALVTEPPILLADEPTGALDSKNGENILNIFDSFRKVYNMSIIMVTHDINIAKRTDRIIHINDGKIV